MTSIDYYNQNGQAFFDRTIQGDVSYAYEAFTSHLRPGTKILDAGCGSGRDALYFSTQGFDVVAFDGSVEMVRLSSKLLGKETLHLLFQEMDFQGEFDGIWASASLLHVAYEELPQVFRRLHRSLKSSGILFATFKYGQNYREDAEGRTFYDMDEKTILPYLKELFTLLDVWVTPDTRSTKSPSPSRMWFNILCRKWESAL